MLVRGSDLPAFGEVVLSSALWPESELWACGTTYSFGFKLNFGGGGRILVVVTTILTAKPCSPESA